MPIAFTYWNTPGSSGKAIPAVLPRKPAKVISETASASFGLDGLDGTSRLGGLIRSGVLCGISAGELGLNCVGYPVRGRWMEDRQCDQHYDSERRQREKSDA